MFSSYLLLYRGMNEKWQGTLKKWHLYVFWIGLVFDTAGTTVMGKIAVLCPTLSTMPVLLLAGEKDALLHSRRAVVRIKRLLPQAEAYLLPGIGHVLVNLTDRILPFLLSEHSNA